MTTPSLTPIEFKEHTCTQGHYGEIVLTYKCGVC